MAKFDKYAVVETKGTKINNVNDFSSLKTKKGHTLEYNKKTKRFVLELNGEFICSDYSSSAAKWHANVNESEWKKASEEKCK